jgi:hypothetical protein
MKLSAVAAVAVLALGSFGCASTQTQAPAPAPVRDTSDWVSPEAVQMSFGDSSPVAAPAARTAAPEGNVHGAMHPTEFTRGKRGVLVNLPHRSGN